MNAVRAFWAAITSHLPDELRLNVSPVVDTYTYADGELFSSSTAGNAPAVVAGTSTAGYAGGSGVKINWNTGQIRNGRRVRGATFIVPVASTVWTANGTLGAVATSAFNTAAANLLTALSAGGTSLCVYSRPLPVSERNPQGRAGFTTQVTSGSVSNKSAILRGRRD